MPANANWERWIVASINKFFSDRMQGLHLLVEGQDRDVGDLSDYAQIRIVGPLFNESNKDFWRIDVQVDMLIVSKRDKADIYRVHRNTGVVTTAFENGIPVFEYGDDGSVLGCLQLHDEISQTLEITQHGQPDPDSLFQYTTVVGNYKMFLEA